MASSKARTRNRPAASAAGRGSSASRGGTKTSAAAGKAQAGKAQAGKAQQRKQAAEPVEETPTGPPTWLKIATFVLAIAGLGVSIYLTYTHYTNSSLAGCHESLGASGPVNCTKVQTSSQSLIFGVIPVAVTGLVYYVFMVAILSPWGWKSTWEWMPKLRLAAVIAGIGMVLYLLYAELFQIGAICLYCTAVHVITFLIFALIAVSAALWGLAPAPRRATAA